MADGMRVRYLNVNDKLADPQGRLFDGMMHERDKLHPTLKGYQVWADALKPILTELLGPPAATDQRRRRPAIRARGSHDNLSLRAFERLRAVAIVIRRLRARGLSTASRWADSPGRCLSAHGAFELLQCRRHEGREVLEARSSVTTPTSS